MKKLNLLSIAQAGIMISFFIVLLGCNKSRDLRTESEQEFNVISNTKESLDAILKVDNMKVSFQAQGKDIVTSNLTISDLSAEDQNLIFTNYKLNTEEPYFKLKSHEMVISEADRLLKTVDKSEIDRMISVFEKIAKIIYSDGYMVYPEAFRNQLFFHGSILNSVKRAIETNVPNCNCTPVPSYFIGQTGFFCQEDFQIDKKALVSKLKANSVHLSSSEHNVLSYLSNAPSENVTLSKIYNLLEPNEAFLAKVSRVQRHVSDSKKMSTKDGVPNTLASKCIQGSTYGCCGNYAGCCWAWTYTCFAHDVLCYDCGKWWCLPGCKPETPTDKKIVAFLSPNALLL